MLGELWGMGTMRSAFPDYSGDSSTPSGSSSSPDTKPRHRHGPCRLRPRRHTQARFLNPLGADTSDVTATSDTNEALIEQADVTQHSYTAPGDDHTPLADPQFYNLAVNGVRSSTGSPP